MMKTNNEIEHIANSVLTKYVKQGGAFKVFNDIMLGEHIKFREIPSVSFDFVGVLTKGNSDQVYIVINKNIDNIGRKNFTIAHELGHYFLNHRLTDNIVYCTNSDISEIGSLNKPIEREANYFATCFLMPRAALINDFYNLLGNRDFLEVTNSSYKGWKRIREALIEIYGVSEAALRFRLQELKLASFEFKDQ